MYVQKTWRTEIQEKKQCISWLNKQKMFKCTKHFELNVLYTVYHAEYVHSDYYIRHVYF